MGGSAFCKDKSADAMCATHMRVAMPLPDVGRIYIPPENMGAPLLYRGEPLLSPLLGGRETANKKWCVAYRGQRTVFLSLPKLENAATA